MGAIPLDLYHISQSSSTWRRVYSMLYDLYHSEIPDPEVSLSRRDLLIEYGIPVEAWIDLRILETWFRKGIPVPLACLLGYVLSLQREDGSFSVDGIVPNSGATYRTVELALLLGSGENPKVRKAVDYLVRSLRGGGLASPGPVEGALLEVGTTARFLHVLYRFDIKTYSQAIESMRSFLLKRVCVGEDEAAWHTDLLPEELKDLDSCIGGATSLALYSLCLLGREEDKILINRAVKWLLKRQKEGGWSDSPEGSPNVDNTFNAVRALKASREFLDPALRMKVERSLEEARKFLNRIDPYELRAVSLRAMYLRAKLLLIEDPLDKKVLKSLKALTDMKDRWFSKEGHLYNEMLIAGIAIGEWLCSVKENPYRLVREGGNEELKELLSFPVEIPPLFPGHRDGVGERLLNFLVKTHRGYRLVEKLSESFTIRDMVSLIVAAFLMLGIFLSEDFLKALILPERNSKVDVYSTLIVISLYFLWLSIKFRFRESILHFLITTILSILIALFLLWGWLRYSDEMVSFLLKEGEILPLLRIVIVFSLILDVGRRLINVSELDRILLSRRSGL